MRKIKIIAGLIGVLGSVGASVSVANAGMALTPEQEKVRTTAQEIGSSACVETTVKVCFGETLQAIAYQESSFGDNRIGAGKEIVYFYIQHGKRVVVSETEAKRSRHKIQKEVVDKPLSERALGSFQIMPETAKRVISERGLTKWSHLLKNDDKLVKELIKNDRLGAHIAAEYLKMNYENWSEEKRGSPWKYTVSKYNGGSGNHEYVQDIVGRMVEIRETLGEAK